MCKAEEKHPNSQFARDRLIKVSSKKGWFSAVQEPDSYLSQYHNQTLQFKQDIKGSKKKSFDQKQRNTRTDA